MLKSLAFIFIVGACLGALVEKLKIPKLVGMLVAGCLLGPYMWNLLDPNILLISADLRKIALIIILLRAGLSLDLQSLKEVGGPALLMCFLPASLEMLGVFLLAPALLGVSSIEALVIGAVLAAVSPAVVVPRMIHLIEQSYGTQEGIPQMIMAGASVDDIYVIVLFTAFTSLAQGGGMNCAQFLSIPTSILLGIGGGFLVGELLNQFFARIRLTTSQQTLTLLALSFLLVVVEDALAGFVGFSALLAIMTMGAVIRQEDPHTASQLSLDFNALWTGAEILLFVLVGATINISFAWKAGPLTLVLIMGALLFRVMGVFLSVAGTSLTRKERLFAAMAYLPKATVQAAIGGIPLAMGLACGEIVLTVAVIAIIVTAPLGAFLIDHFYPRLLKQAVKKD